MRCSLVCTMLIIVLTGCAGVESNAQLDNCPQPRFTGKAPQSFLEMTNAVVANKANIAAGEKLYQSGIKPVSCAQCHGRKGDGMGPMSAMFEPPPRNFTCAQTINNVPDGQLFWIIQNGSTGTSMPGFAQLSDTEIWQIVHYIRKLANGHEPS